MIFLRSRNARLAINLKQKKVSGNFCKGLQWPIKYQKLTDWISLSILLPAVAHQVTKAYRLDQPFHFTAYSGRSSNKSLQIGSALPFYCLQWPIKLQIGSALPSYRPQWPISLSISLSTVAHQAFSSYCPQWPIKPFHLTAHSGPSSPSLLLPVVGHQAFPSFCLQWLIKPFHLTAYSGPSAFPSYCLQSPIKPFHLTAHSGPSSLSILLSTVAHQVTKSLRITYIITRIT